MKKIISVLSIVCLTASMLSVGALAEESAPEYVAKIEETGEEFASIQAAVDAAQDGKTVVVTRSHNLDCTALTESSLIYVSGNKAITIDLNGCTVTADYTGDSSTYEYAAAIIKLANGSKLTMIDSSSNKTGTIHAKTTQANETKNQKTQLTDMFEDLTEGDNNDGIDGSKLIIKSGNYRMDYGRIAASIGGSAIVTTANSRNTLITGGTFIMGNVGAGDASGNYSPWILNGNYNDANSIVVTGGTFNDNVNQQFWEYEVLIPKERALRDNNDGTWTVVDSVAYVEEHSRKYPNNSSGTYYTRETGYASLADAVASANNYSDSGVTADKTNKIILLKDCVVSNTLPINDHITITAADGLEKVPTVSRQGDGAMFNLVDDNKLSIIGGTYDCNVNEWCPAGYAAVENEDGFFDVIPGYKVSYYLVDNTVNPAAQTLVKTEGVATGGKAKGYIHVVEDGEGDEAIFDWYSDTGLTTPYDFNTPVSENTALYGALKPAFIVDFDSDEGTEVDRQVIKAEPENDEVVKVTEPTPPTKENSTFIGWFEDEGLNNEFDFNTPITDSTDIYAKWIDDSIVSFITNGGSSVEDVYVPYGEKLEKPLPDPTKSGYTFGGWYTDEALTDEYNFDAVVAQESVFTLYAKWNKIVYTPPVYTISAPEGLQTSPASARYGQTVTVTVSDDYETDGIKVTDNFGKKVKVSRDGDTYTFVMPYTSVKVEELVNPFEDAAKDTYYFDAVLWAVDMGITEGTSDTTFSPGAACSRAQIVTFLWRAAGCPEPAAAENIFSDVDLDSYYGKAVLWAAENGITNGTSDTTFSPDADCSRGEIVVFLSRFANAQPVSGSNPFTDVDEDAYYADAVLWAANNNVTNGTGANTFSPDEECSRAQAVTLLYRWINK